MRRLVVPGILVLSSAACSGDPASSSASASAAPASTGPGSATSAGVKASASSAPSSSAPPASPVHPPPRGPRPTAAEWCAAKQATLTGPRGVSCAMLEVREWLLVACPAGAGDDRETLVYDRAVPGGGSIANADEVAVAPIADAKDAVVVSLRPGTTAKPIFFYRPTSHPEWTRDISFSFELKKDAAEWDERTFGGGPWPSTADREPSAACASISEKGAVSGNAPGSAPPGASASPSAQASPALEIADVEGIEPRPAEDAWAAPKEALVNGSDALGCKTKTIDHWFHAECSGKTTFSSVTVTRGKRATQTEAKVEGGRLTIVTPYVEGTDLRAELESGAGKRWFTLGWPTGKRPLEIGRFTETP